MPAETEISSVADQEVFIEQVQVVMADVTSMTTEELKLDMAVFDPAQPQLRSKLLKRLGFPETATIEKYTEGDHGSFNDGVWLLSDTNSHGLVLKLVPHQRARPSRATDSEKYVNLQRQRPNIVTENSLSFPLKIFQLKGPSGTKPKDLLVMREAPGFQITHHLYYKFHGGSSSALLDIFKELGIFMCTMHRVYKGMQHGDCQPSNVFYDETTGYFTLIDVADFGFGPYMADGGEDDVEHFIVGLKSLSEWYGENLIADCERQFRTGYMEEKQRCGYKRN